MLDGKYEYKDAFLIPQYSEVSSRSEVDTSVSLFNDTLKIEVPVISANMDSITGFEMAAEIWRAGGIGALHRFWPIPENLSAYGLATGLMSYVPQVKCFVSVGINGDKPRAACLYEAGARYFIVDIAHGHSLQMKEMLKFFKTELKGAYVVAGNVATQKAVEDLEEWGADAIKVGIGPGAACLTKNVTGVTYPQLSAVFECAMVAHVPIIADGGIREIGDIAKAIAAGADLVMCGRLFASCKETPSITIDGHKVYRGMASRDAMLTIRPPDNLPTPEGATMIINDPVVMVGNVVKDIQGGLQSAFSYSGALNLKEFQAKARFGIRSS